MVGVNSTFMYSIHKALGQWQFSCFNLHLVAVVVVAGTNRNITFYILLLMVMLYCDLLCSDLWNGECQYVLLY